MRKVLLLCISLVMITSLLLVTFGCAAPSPAPAPAPAPKPAPAPAPKPAPAPAPAPPPAPAPKPEIPVMKLLLSSPWPPPTVNVQSGATMRIWKEVERLTDGKVTVDTYWGSSLSGPFDTPDLLQQGVINLSLTFANYTETKFPLGNYEYVFPFGPEDSKVVGLAKWQMYKEIPAFQEMFAQYNIRSLFALPTENYGWGSVKPLRSIADFNGRKFTIANRWQSMWMTKAGLVTMGASLADVYQLHQQGIAEGNVLPTLLTYAIRLHEVSPYLLHGYGAMANAEMMINLDTWNRLGPEVQRMVEGLAYEALSDWYPAMLEEELVRVMGIMEKEGAKFTKMDAKFRQDWYAIIPDVPAAWAEEVTAKGYPGWEIAKRWQEIVAGMGAPFERQWGIKK